MVRNPPDLLQSRHDLPRELHAAGWPPLVPMLYLSCRPGTPQQKTWCLRRAVTVIGSRSTAHIILRHEAVSKTHAAILCDGSDPILCDLVSRNGTFVGGVRIRSSRLKEGDEVRIGPYDIRIHTQPLPGSRGRNYESGQFQAILPAPGLWLVDSGGSVALTVREGVAVVGTRPGADVRVESEVPVPALAILMPWRRGWAVYDLAHDDELRTQLNGARVYSSVLQQGDRLMFNRQMYQVVFNGDTPPQMDAASLLSGRIGT